MTHSLVDLAKTVFQSLDEFIAYHGIDLTKKQEVSIQLRCLYEIYCEQSDNLLDFGTFCANIVGTTNHRRTVIVFNCNNPTFFRERNLAYVFRQKKETRFNKIPSFKS